MSDQDFRKHIQGEANKRIHNVEDDFKIEYRVILTHSKLGANAYGVHEVYFSTDGTPHSWTDTPLQVCGDSTEDLINEIEFFKAALSKPYFKVILNGDDEKVLEPIAI